MSKNTITVNFTLNGKKVSVETAPNKRMVDFLRDDCGCLSVKEGCGEGECGACTVLLDDQPVHACLTLAIQLEGRHVTTIEGLSASGELDVLQRAFVEELAIQCGFCTTGMIMSAKALLLRAPDPDEKMIREALSGNICRCSGYVQIVRAVQRAAKELREVGA